MWKCWFGSTFFVAAVLKVGLGYPSFTPVCDLVLGLVLVIFGRRFFPLHDPFAIAAYLLFDVAFYGLLFRGIIFLIQTIRERRSRQASSHI